MQKNKHTPGPWEISAPEDMPGYYCLINAVERFEAAYYSDPVDIEAQDVTFAEERANAVLMASSPNLLECLWSLSDAVDQIIKGTPEDRRDYEHLEVELIRARECYNKATQTTILPMH